MIYRDFWKNTELTALLGNPKTPGERAEKIRRSITPLYYETANKLNFLDIYISSTTETDNIYVTRAFFTVDFYCKSITDMNRMIDLVGDILLNRNIMCENQHGIASETKGVYRYRMIFRPLIWSQ